MVCLPTMYHMLHGCEPTADIVLQMLDVDRESVTRFRDAYFTYQDANTEPVMVIMTRTGSTSWTEARNEQLQLLPGFIDVADDEFDSSMALFRFAVPEVARAAVLTYLTAHGPPLTLREKTEQACGPDRTRRQTLATEQIARMLKRVVATVLEKDPNKTE